MSSIALASVIVCLHFAILAGAAESPRVLGGLSSADLCSQLDGVVKGGSCFYAPSGNAKQSWTNSQAACQGMGWGGHVASISSESEFRDIKAAARAPVSRILLSQVTA